MPFSNEIKQRAMVACGRRCCICHKFCGNNLEVHHIKPQAENGTDTFDNAIPLCFDCHAEVGQYNPKHPKGIKFTQAELIQHRDNWYSIIASGRTESGDSIPKVEPIKITKNENTADALLIRIATGAELLQYMNGSAAFEYKYDEPNTREEAACIADFVQQLTDLLDSGVLEDPSQQIMLGFDLKDMLSSLETCGYWVFCGKENRTLSGGVRPPEAFPVMLLRIVRKDNPAIYKNKEDHA